MKSPQLLIAIALSFGAPVASAGEGNTLRGVTLKSYGFSQSEGGLLLMGKFTITNSNAIAARDFLVACEIFGESGTKIDLRKNGFSSRICRVRPNITSLKAT